MTWSTWASLARLPRQGGGFEQGLSLVHVCFRKWLSYAHVWALQDSIKSTLWDGRLLQTLVRRSLIVRAVMPGYPGKVVGSYRFLRNHYIGETWDREDFLPVYCKLQTWRGARLPMQGGGCVFFFFLNSGDSWLTTGSSGRWMEGWHICMQCTRDN